LDENDDEAIFPLRYVGGMPYIIINKAHFKCFETDRTFVLEATPTTPDKQTEV